MEVEQEQSNVTTYYYCWDTVILSAHALPWFVIETLSLTVLNVIIIGGNFMVILSVIMNKHLRATTNLFIVSLAAADMAVGFLVLPFSTTTEIFGTWLFGVVWCQIWLSMDVWLCTASIYNLLAITVDRYVAVTKPLSYKLVLTQNKAILIITLVWILSFCICFPFMVASWPEAFKRVVDLTSYKTMLQTDGNSTDFAATPCDCTQMNNSAGYIAYSALGSFYIPMTVICYFYFRIYRTVRRVANSTDNGYIGVKNHTNSSINLEAQGGNQNNSNGSEASPMLGRNYNTAYGSSSTLRIHRGGYNPASPIGSRREHCNNTAADDVQEAARYLQCPRYNRMRRTSADSVITLTTNSADSSRRSPSPSLFRRSVKMFFNGSVKRSDDSSSDSGKQRLIHYGRRYQKKLSIELKALKIVGIVTGCFVACWLGFCVVYSMQALPWCENFNCVSSTTVSIVVWLGYVNSALNPFIYAACNKHYRATFKRILRCTCFHFGQWDRDRRRQQQFVVATLCRQAGACMLVVHSSQEHRACSVAGIGAPGGK